MALLIQIKAIFVSIIILLFGLLPVCIIAIPFPITRRLKLVGSVWCRCSKLLLRYACQARLDIQEDHRSAAFRGIPAYGLYVANHQSIIDIPVIISTYIAPPIMKKEILYIPIFGQLGWVSGALPVSRSSLNSRKRVFEQAKHRILKERVGIQVYPEGTRSKDSLPKSYEQIKRTLLVFAFNEKIPVIPTSLYGTRGVLSNKGWVRPGRHLGIIVHKEMLPQDYQNPDEFCRAVWGKVVSGHDEIKARLSPLNEN